MALCVRCPKYLCIKIGDSKILFFFKQVNFDVRGIVPEVFTPLYLDGTINYDMTPFYADYLKYHGIKAILGMLIYIYIIRADDYRK